MINTTQPRYHSCSQLDVAQKSLHRYYLHIAPASSVLQISSNSNRFGDCSIDLSISKTSEIINLLIFFLTKNHQSINLKNVLHL